VKLDAEIDRLYGVPLDEFIDERAKLAKELRRDGDREGAERVKALRKPTVGAWAINQALRRRGRERDELLAAGEKLRAAHEALLSGGDPSALREATSAERALVAALADTAEVIATEAGKGGPALKERVRGTLHAATLDEEVRDELVHGRVVRERDAVGMGTFGGAPEVVAPRERGGRTDAKGGGSKGGRTKAKRGGGSTQGKRDGTKRGGVAKGDRAATAERRREEREQAKRERAEREQAERERAAQVAAAERSLAAAHSAFTKAEAAHDDAAGTLDAVRRALREAEAAEREARKAKRERAKEVAKREREVEKLRAGSRRRR
jgi:hypothetical protein